MSVQVWTGRGCEKAPMVVLALRLHKTPNFLILCHLSLYNKKLKGIKDHPAAASAAGWPAASSITQTGARLRAGAGPRHSVAE